MAFSEGPKTFRALRELQPTNNVFQRSGLNIVPPNSLTIQVAQASEGFADNNYSCPARWKLFVYRSHLIFLAIHGARNVTCWSGSLFLYDYG